MRLKSLLALIVAVWVAAFLVLNWRMFSAPARINLLFFGVDASVGFAVLALAVPMLVVSALYLGVWQTRVQLERRRQSRELQAHKQLAENAETSRVNQLGATIHNDMAGLEQRLQVAIEAMQGEIHDTERSLAATLGEMDDRIKRWKEGLDGPV